MTSTPEEHPTQAIPLPEAADPPAQSAPEPAQAPPPPVWPPAPGYGAPAPGYAPPPPGYAPAPYPGYGGYPAPGYGLAPVPYVPPAPTSSNAIVGLVLAITSWIICPIIPAIIALVLARQSTQEIENSGGRVGGAGLNTATRIVSWINIGVWGAGFVIFGLFFAFFALVGAASS